jgi:hypothetical protein
VPLVAGIQGVQAQNQQNRNEVSGHHSNSQVHHRVPASITSYSRLVSEKLQPRPNPSTRNYKSRAKRTKQKNATSRNSLSSCIRTAIPDLSDEFNSTAKNQSFWPE